MNAPASPDTKPRVAVLLAPDMRSTILDADAERVLSEIANVVAPGLDGLTADTLQSLVSGADALLTGWGTPPLTPDLVRDSTFKFVAHSAGSIRRLVPADAIETGRLRVSHSATDIAEAVAEFVLAQMLMHLREPHRYDAGLKAGADWWELRTNHVGRLLGAQTVGIVGAGYVGRLVIRLVKAFGAKVLACDPFLSPERAGELGVERVDLDDLLSRSDIVSLHVPVLPETRGMIGAAQFAAMRDGALFVNSARSALIDEPALIAELGRGRISAALDVFDNEPLAQDSPFLKLDNVLIAPHGSGHSKDSHYRQGGTAVREIARFLNGQPLEHEVTAATLITMS